MKAKDALYAEAEAVYRRTVQIRMDAYSGRPIPDLTTVAVGSGLESLKADIGEGYVLVSGELVIHKLQRVPDRSRDGSEVALLSCLDASSVRLSRAGATSSPSPRGIESTYYRRDGGVLRLNFIESRGQQSC